MTDTAHTKTASEMIPTLADVRAEIGHASHRREIEEAKINGRLGVVEGRLSAIDTGQELAREALRRLDSQNGINADLAGQERELRETVDRLTRMVTHIDRAQERLEAEVEARRPARPSPEETRSDAQTAHALDAAARLVAQGHAGTRDDLDTTAEVLSFIDTPTGRALAEIVGERARQVEIHNRTADLDDNHDLQELASHAAVFALLAADKPDDAKQHVPEGWDIQLRKPTHRRKLLIKSAAMALAALAWLDRKTEADNVPV